MTRTENDANVPNSARAQVAVDNGADVYSFTLMLLLIAQLLEYEYMFQIVENILQALSLGLIL